MANIYLLSKKPDSREYSIIDSLRVSEDFMNIFDIAYSSTSFIDYNGKVKPSELLEYLKYRLGIETNYPVKFKYQLSAIETAKRVIKKVKNWEDKYLVEVS